MVDVNTQAIEKLTTMMKDMMDRLNQFFSQDAKVTKSADGWRKYTREISSLDEAVKKLTRSVVDNKKSWDDNEKSISSILNSFKKLKDEYHEAAQSAMAEIRTELLNQQEMVDNLRAAYSKLADDVDYAIRKRIGDALNQMEADVEATREKATDTATGSKSNVLPSAITMVGNKLFGQVATAGGMEPLMGILEAFGGGAGIAALLGAGQFLRPQAARALADWQQMIPTARYGGGVDITQLDMQQFYQNSPWQVLMSSDTMSNIWGRGAAFVKSYGDNIAGANAEMKDLMDMTLRADVTMGKDFGTSMDRMNELMFDFGQTTNQAKGNLVDLTKHFGDTQQPMLWSQLVFDLQGRLGALGVNMGQLTKMVDTMNLATGGQAALVTAGISGVFGWLQGQSLPMQAIMGAGVTGGGTGLAAANVYQRLISGLTVSASDPRKLQDVMPQMLAQFATTTQMSKLANDTIPLFLQFMGFNTATSQIMADVFIRAGKDPTKFGAAFREDKTAMEDLAKSLKDPAERTADTLELMNQAQGTVTQLLTNIFNVIQQSLAMMMDVLVAVAEVIAHRHSAKQIMKNLGGLLYKRMLTMDENMKKALGPTANIIGVDLPEIMAGVEDTDTVTSPPKPDSFERPVLVIGKGGTGKAPTTAPTGDAGGATVGLPVSGAGGIRIGVDFDEAAMKALRHAFEKATSGELR